MKEKWRRWWNRVCDELFPDRYTCIFCDDELPTPNRLGTCSRCASALPLIGAQAFCLKCGKPLAAEGKQEIAPTAVDTEGGSALTASLYDSDKGCYCHLCRTTARHFDRVRSAFAYQDPVRRAIHKLKFGHAAYLARYLSAYMADVYLDDPVAVDMVVAVPLHPKRQRERGYNQAALLAEHLCDRLRLVYQPNGLVKVRHTVQQAKMNSKQRQDNLKDSFAADKQLFAGKTVLVVDDVLTTGNTLDEVARTLKAAGAVHVYGLTLANVAET